MEALFESGTEAVVRMPRLSGTRCGVKPTTTGLPDRAASSCSISGVCRWVPMPYACTFSLASAKRYMGSTDRPCAPAPVTPDLPSITMPSARPRPALSSGAVARIAPMA